MSSLVARVASGICVAVFLSGCAAVPSKASRSPRDPMERWNRSVDKVNNALDRALIKPAAKAYVRVTPQVVRTGVSNVVANLLTPTTMINDALQGKLKAAGHDLGRFLFNSTFGLAGLLDPASIEGLQRNDEDFGQTLGKWGVPSGPYFVIPILGPSTVRDAPAKVVDNFTNPRQYMNTAANLSLAALEGLDKRAELLSLDETLKKAFDPYVFVRDAYLRHRDYQVADGNIADEELADPEAQAPADTQKPAP
jgi:phospholipid-binding lipoprotein MlaA